MTLIPFTSPRQARIWLSQHATFHSASILACGNGGEVKRYTFWFEEDAFETARSPTPEYDALRMERIAE